MVNNARVKRWISPEAQQSEKGDLPYMRPGVLDQSGYGHLF